MSLSDVETGLVSAIAAALYPSGTTASSAVCAPCRIYRGWPVGNALDASIVAGSVDVSVFPRAGLSRNTTRYPVAWQQLAPAQTTLTVSAAGTQVALGGSAGAVQLVGVQLDDRTRYVYKTENTDTPALAAAGLAALIPGASASGDVITVLDAADLVARVGGIGAVTAEVRREWQEMQITVWSPTPELRDAVSSVIDVALSQLPFLALPDGSSARLLYRSQMTSDVTSKAGIWRQDLFYAVEFGINATQPAADLLFPAVNVIPD